MLLALIVAFQAKAVLMKTLLLNQCITSSKQNSSFIVSTLIYTSLSYFGLTMLTGITTCASTAVLIIARLINGIPLIEQGNLLVVQVSVDISIPPVSNCRDRLPLKSYRFVISCSRSPSQLVAAPTTAVYGTNIDTVRRAAINCFNHSLGFITMIATPINNLTTH